MANGTSATPRPTANTEAIPNHNHEKSTGSGVQGTSITDNVKVMRGGHARSHVKSRAVRELHSTWHTHHLPNPDERTTCHRH
jgi:hypothetical protein